MKGTPNLTFRGFSNSRGLAYCWIKENIVFLYFAIEVGVLGNGAHNLAPVEAVFIQFRTF